MLLLAPRCAYSASPPNPSRLFAEPTDIPAANPVRCCKLPGRRPWFDTLPYDRPPLIPNVPCARATAGAAGRIRAATVASKRFIVLLHAWHRAPPSTARLRWPSVGVTPVALCCCDRTIRSQENGSQDTTIPLR